VEDRVRTRVVKPLRRGQITIPQEFRDALGITEDTLLQVTLRGSRLEISPVEVRGREEASSWLRELYDLYAPVREDLSRRYSPEEIDSAIDEAVRTVRREGA
jgi:AbrB family looped-hinge helix DNA binding protein